MPRQPRWHSLWQSYKMDTGYDATNPRSVLRHAWSAWSFWREMHGGPKAYQQFHASASTLARRALRGWRRWTIRTRLSAPSWQRCRIKPQQLPPLPARKAPARLQSRPALSYLEYGRKFWKNRETYQQTVSREHHSKLHNEWLATHHARLQEPFTLAPDRPWLRSWRSSKSSNIMTETRYRIWEELQSRPLQISFYHCDGRFPPAERRMYLSRNNCRLPPTARYVLCHYGQPHSWHEIRASVTSDDTRWTQWQESVISTTVGSCQGSIRWAGIQPIIASLRTQLAVLASSRRQSYRRHPRSHQRSWQPPRHQPGPHSIQPGPTRPSQPRCPARSVSLVAGFPGFGTHATDLAALDQYIEQAAVCIQRAFRRLRRQRSSCLGSSVARPQTLTVCIQPEDEEDLDSKGEFSIADTEASQASTLLACFLLACQAFTRSSRHRRQSRRMVNIASASRAWFTSESWASRPTADLRLLHCPTARRVECAFRRRRLGLHRGCTDGTGFRLSLEP